MDLKLTVDGLEKERDFYFSKLRDIELICQEHENENSPIIAGIISVLYATEVRAGHRCPRDPWPILLPGLPWDEPPIPEAALASGYIHSLGCLGGDWALLRLLHRARRCCGDGLRAGTLTACGPRADSHTSPPARRASPRQRTTSWRSSSQRTRTSTSPGTSCAHAAPRRSPTIDIRGLSLCASPCTVTHHHGSWRPSPRPWRPAVPVEAGLRNK